MCKSPNTPTKNWSLVALLRNCVLGSCCRSCFKFDDTVNENDSVNGGAVDAAKSSSHADADEDRNIMKIRVLRCFLMNVDTRNGIFSTVSSMVCLSLDTRKSSQRKDFSLLSTYVVGQRTWVRYLQNKYLPRWTCSFQGTSVLLTPHLYLCRKIVRSTSSPESFHAGIICSWCRNPT